MTGSRLMRATILASVLTGAAAPGAAQDQVVTIGVLAPLTGATASDGEEFVRGVQWAVDEANAAGGVAGYTFDIAVADVRDHSAGNVSSAVERLVGTDGVHIILTGYASLSLFEVDLMAEYGMPYIAAGPSPQFAAIVEQDPDYYWCCWSYTADFRGYETDLLPLVESLGEAGQMTVRDRTVAIVSSDNPYSRTISEGMIETFADAGWTVTVDELVPFGEVADWRPILAQVRQDPPELLINTDYIPGNAALFLRQFLDAPTDSVVFLQYAPSVPEFVALTGELSTGVLYNLINGPLDSPQWPRGQELMRAYEARYGLESGAYGVGLYEMAHLYFRALEEVGDPTDHEAIGRAIGRQTAVTVAGNLEFDPDTHVAVQSDDHIPVSFWQIWDGERYLIGPARYAAAEFRRPPWLDGE